MVVEASLEGVRAPTGDRWSARTDRPFRVLSLDGGGMRGAYQCAYLDAFARRVECRSSGMRDIGKAFDLIVGTSTGAIVASALFAAVPMRDVLAMYREHGRRIFPLQKWRFRWLTQTIVRAFGLGLRDGERALVEVLRATFGNGTLAQVYQDRGIALGVPALNLHHHWPVVFKTPHLTRLNGRDNDRSLVDVCLASSAAPILRTMACLKEPGASADVRFTYVDGGLWANNPALVAMIEAEEILRDRGQHHRPIHLFMLGTLADAAGEVLSGTSPYRGVWGWRAGMRALTAAMNASAAVAEYQARKLAEFHGRGSFAYRLPSQGLSAELRELLPNMDDARSRFLDALERQAMSDVDHVWGLNDPRVQAFIEALQSAPLRGGLPEKIP